MYQQYQRLPATLLACLYPLPRRKWIGYHALSGMLFILTLIALALLHLYLVIHVLPRDPDPPWPVVIA